MERRALLAFALIFLILFGWSWLSQQYRQPPAVPPAAAATEAPVADASPPTEPPSEVPVPSTERIAGEAAEEIKVETDVFEVVLTTEGARALSWKLKLYPAKDGQAVELLPRLAERDALPLG